MKQLELIISKDLLTKFSRTEEISLFSPKASSIIKKSKKMYPNFNDGYHSISIESLKEAAKELGIQVKSLTGSDALIGINVKEFEDGSFIAAFSNEFVCIHGPAPYSFIMNKDTNEVSKKSYCTKCGSKIKDPDSEEISKAKNWVQNQSSQPKINSQQVEKVRPNNLFQPRSGALIMAMSQLGFEMEVKITGGFHIRRKEVEVVLEKSKK